MTAGMKSRASGGVFLLSCSILWWVLAAWHLADKDRPELAEMRLLLR